MDRHAAADRAELALRRALIMADVTTPLERAEVINELIHRLEDERDSCAKVAIQTGDTIAAVGRAVGISRQAAHRRYGPDRPAAPQEKPVAAGA